MEDVYRDFAELAAREPADAYAITARPGPSGALVAAPHAGGIEPGTGELARAVAGGEHALYLFEGLKEAGNGDLHLTSIRFDEPRFGALAAGADRLLALHGCRGDAPAVFVGGRDRALAAQVSEALRAAGFAAERAALAHLAGEHPANLCNRGRSGAGVQLELTRALRAACFARLSRAGRQQPTPLLEELAGALRAALRAPRV